MKCFNDYVVNVNNLKNNALKIKEHIGDRCKFCAVVKANAYGVGVETVCKALKGLADFFAVACLKEALNIRVFDKTTPILILGYVDRDDYNLVAEQNISVSIGDIDTLQYIHSHMAKRINIHLQVNTGLNRYGFRTLSEFSKALSIISSSQHLNLEGVYSHFATKSNDITFINKQFLRFLQFKKKVTNKGILFHIANSYATIHSKKYHLDMVRNGFILYGNSKNKLAPNPVLSIQSRVISVMNVKKGDTIGYDRTFRVSKSMRVGVVPVGYADGYNRLLSNKGSVIISGKKFPIVGLICMDVFMIDISGEDVKVGDRVTLLGENGGKEIILQELAESINMSPYELMCNLNAKRMNYITK